MTKEITFIVRGLSLQAASQFLPAFIKTGEELKFFLAERIKLKIIFSFVDSDKKDGTLSFKRSGYDFGDKHIEPDVEIKKIFLNNLDFLQKPINIQNIGPEFGSGKFEDIEKKTVQIENK